MKKLERGPNFISPACSTSFLVLLIFILYNIYIYIYTRIVATAIQQEWTVSSLFAPSEFMDFPDAAVDGPVAPIL